MITEIISTILDLFRAGSDFRGARAEKRDAALDAIYMACTETKIYVVEWDRTGKRNKKKEQELAKLWKKASIPVRHFDQLLADKCYHKGDYWLNPDHWDTQDIEHLGIDLDRVTIEARDLKVMSDEQHEKHTIPKKARTA